MGIIKRQGIKQSSVAFLGVIIGVLNVILYTAALTEEQIGLIRFLVATAMFIAPLIFMGGNTLTIRFFPDFKDKSKGHNGFLFFLTAILTLGFSVFFFFILGFQDVFIGFFSEKAKTVEEYFVHLILLTFFIAYSNLFTSYTSNFKRIVVPTIYNELLIKIVQPLLVLAFFYGLLSFPWIVNGIVITYGIILLCLMSYLIWLGEWHMKPNFTHFKKPLLKEMGVYAGYGVLGSFGSKLANKIDTLMITALIGLKSNGIYFISSIIGNITDIPRKAISKISAPILAQSLKDGDMENVEKLYQKSSITQFIFGLFILIGIWLSIDDLFEILPNGEKYAIGKDVALILGLANVINMVTGLNEEILGLSKYFRYKFYFIFAMAIVNIIANLVFIPIWGINGAALATLLSLLTYNLLKFLLLKIKMNLQPFTWQTLWVLAIGVFACVWALLLPTVENAFLNLMLKSSLFTIVYGGLILYFKISEDINDLVFNFLQKIKR